jgi:hypothetical protein
VADGGAAAVAAIIANAIKASGTVVRVEPETFVDLLRRVEKPLIIYKASGFLSSHQYLTSYKGFVFFTRSREQIDLPRSAEVIVADKVWIPS